MKVYWRECDLWREFDGGWSENASYVRTGEIDVPEDCSKHVLRCRVRRDAGWNKVKSVDWNGDGWRSGTMGLYYWTEWE